MKKDILNIKQNINSNDYADNVDFILPSKVEDSKYHDSVAILHNGFLPNDQRAHYYYYLKPCN